MPRAIFSPWTREQLIASDVFDAAQHLKATEAEDVFAIGECRITCRYRVEPGDFVSRQVLGCLTAIRSDRIRCDQKQVAEQRVLDTEVVVGFIGPADEVDERAESLGQRISGVMVTERLAILVG